MADERCIEFLQWAAPRLGLRWAGFRRVRGQVCKRIARRFRELGLADFAAYRGYLERTPGEWRRLDELCHVSISRFFRDREVFTRLTLLLDERLGTGPCELRLWSAGCASGEEPYSLSMIAAFALAPKHPGLAWQIVATDADPLLLERARRGCYRPSTLREIPSEWAPLAFDSQGEERCIRPLLRERVELLQQDLRREMPAGPFDAILCRNLAFTYFDEPTQGTALERLVARLAPGGLLVIGAHETLPPTAALERAAGAAPIFRRL